LCNALGKKEQLCFHTLQCFTAAILELGMHPVSDPNSLIIQTAGICGDPTVQNSVAAPHHQETSRQETNNTLHNVASHTKPSKSTTPKHQNVQKPQKKCKPKTPKSQQNLQPKKKKQIPQQGGGDENKSAQERTKERKKERRSEGTEAA
jgi:hypothetical protein